MSSLTSTAFDYFRVLRPHKGTLLATCAFVVGCLLLAHHQPHDWRTTAVGALTVFLSYGAGMVMNDCVDYQADAQHKRKRHRPIAAGRISVRAAGGYSFALCTVSMALARSLSNGFAWWNAANIVCMAMYAIGVQEICLIKDIMCGWLAVSPLIGATVLAAKTAGPAQVTKLYWLAALMLPWQTAREILMDLDDMSIDQGKKTTLPFVVGPLWTHRIAYAMFFTLSVAGVSPMYRDMFASQPSVYVPCAVVAGPVLVRAAWMPVDVGSALVEKCTVLLVGGGFLALLLQ